MIRIKYRYDQLLKLEADMEYATHYECMWSRLDYILYEWMKVKQFMLYLSIGEYYNPWSKS